MPPSGSTGQKGELGSLAGNTSEELETEKKDAATLFGVSLFRRRKEEGGGAEGREGANS